MEDRCVCCGEIIPEGRMVCPQCEKKGEKMKFNKPPEFGTRFQFNENMKFEYDGQVHTLVNEIAVKMAEKYDNFIVEQIAMEARASGISDLTVLNKPAIINALTKQIPLQVIMNEVQILCPSCRTDMMGLWDYPDVQDPNYCPLCGQKLKWRTNDGR